jgi:hypothetical protein
MVKLAFKRGKGLISGLIRLLTGSEYSHVEIIIQDKWISSNPEDGGAYIRDLKPLKTTWDYKEIQINDEKIPEALKFAEQQQNKKYDYLGVLRLFTNITKNNQKWFCSELVCTLLKILEAPNTDFCSPQHTAPGDLYEI